MSRFLRWLQKAEPAPSLLSAWPIPRAPNWIEKVNEPLLELELDAVRWAARRGRPLGDSAWLASTPKRLSLTSTLRPRPQIRSLHESKNSGS